ncbi:major facilitator transporter [mine drainage metagenome]|uniref:Major facilitator transporter n=1 Tax=mine drainage metagenome TaxID=410659 RepID=T1CZG7_9ZZZZ
MARQDRIPVWALPYGYLLIIGIGYFFTFFDIADIGYGMPAIEAQFHLSGSQTLFVALAVGLVGYVVGSIAIGSISDRIGRYKILLVTIGITALGSFLDATATGIVTLSIWRFVTGLGSGPTSIWCRRTWVSSRRRRSAAASPMPRFWSGSWARR